MDPSPANPPHEGDPPPSDPQLVRLRAELEGVAEVPVEERVELFEQANATIAEELARLDEV